MKEFKLLQRIVNKTWAEIKTLVLECWPTNQEVVGLNPDWLMGCLISFSLQFPFILMQVLKQVPTGGASFAIYDVKVF